MTTVLAWPRGCTHPNPGQGTNMTTPKLLAHFAARLQALDLLDVTQIIARRHRVSFKEILSHSRVRRVRNARAEVFMLLRAADLSYPEIGAMTGRDHTSVLTVVHRVQKERARLFEKAEVEAAEVEACAK